MLDHVRGVGVDQGQHRVGVVEAHRRGDWLTKPHGTDRGVRPAAGYPTPRGGVDVLT